MEGASWNLREVHRHQCSLPEKVDVNLTKVRKSRQLQAGDA